MGTCCSDQRRASGGHEPRRVRLALVSLAAVAGFMGAPLGLAEKSPSPLKRQHADYFPDKPKMKRTGHFRVLHNTGPRAARTAGRLLNLTRHTFYASFRASGFKLGTLDEPLVCLVFAEKDTFVRYGKAADDRDMSWSGGYYSSRTNRVALYESPAYRIPGVVPDKDEALVTEPRDRREHQDANKGNDDSNTSTNPLHGSDASTVATLARTTHEAAHQMAFNSGLQKRGVMYPFWVSEGLATMFELNEYRALGPAAANPRRKETLLEARDSGTLVPLETFVAQTRLDTSDGDALRRSYAQAWGLFRFLLQERPDDMRRYMQALKSAGFGRRPERALRADFEQTFGDMAEVKDAWQRWLAQLK